MCGGRGVLRSYGELFAIPGTAAFSATGLLARLPISQFSIAVILLISATTGSYGLAGQVAGAAALAGALVMPVIARAVDARGHGLSPRWESAQLERAGEVLVEDLIVVLEELEAASRGRAAPSCR